MPWGGGYGIETPRGVGGAMRKTDEPFQYGRKPKIACISVFATDPYSCIHSLAQNKPNTFRPDTMLKNRK